uniref:Gag-like protein n=1 Tax=Adineta vaga TaxID=104782 RepID=D1D8L8_ADIVA|nr:gag-like protein [Adineta vaga]
MPSKRGRGGGGQQRRYHSVDNQQRATTTQRKQGPQSSQSIQSPQRTTQDGKAGPYALKSSQPTFSIAPLILEGVNLNKLQLNDILKQHLAEVNIHDIQLGRNGIFTLYARDVKSFNNILNDFSSILSSNGQPSATVYVPRSIQRIKDTEKIAFVKRVDLELPNDRITEALKNVGLEVTEVIRLTSKDGKTPTRTVKISFSDATNRNIFVQTGLQVDCMHFTAEPATQNSKPVQCYICLKYNHVAKYCKTKQQVCSRCGENHSNDKCTVTDDAVKCYNCKGNHIATSKECSHYREQEKKMQNMVNQYATTSKQVTQAPSIYNTHDFPPLSQFNQTQKQLLTDNLFDDIINALTSKMETIIEKTTNRLFKALHQKIKKIEKSFGLLDRNNEEKYILTDSDSDSNEQSQAVKIIKPKPKKQQSEADKSSTTENVTSNKPTMPSTPTTSKDAQNKKEGSNTNKRALSSNNSPDASINDNKTLKTSSNDA